MQYGRLLLLLLFPLLSGCAVTTTIIGVKEPDLTAIQSPKQRTQVEKVLGKPLWSPGSSDGLTYEIYQFRIARPPQPGLGAAGIVLDILSIGILESAVAENKLFESVKQLAAAYDSQDNLRFISKEWLVDTPGPGRQMRFHIPPEAGVPATAHPEPLLPLIGPAAQVATLTWGMWMKVVVDGLALQGHEVRLAPGSHDVDFGPNSSLGNYAKVQFFPGRIYQIKKDTFYNQQPRKMKMFWLEDKNSHEVLYCSCSGQ